MNSTGFNEKFLSYDKLIELQFAYLGVNVQIHNSVVLVNCHSIAIGSNVRIDAFTLISAGKGITIGSNVHIASNCTLVGSEEITVEDFCGISHGCRILSASDDFSGIALVGPTVPADLRAVTAAPIRICRHGLLGAGCVVLPGVEIGEGAAVGAMSLVRKSLPPWGIYAGHPLRCLGQRKQDLLALEKVYTARSPEHGR